MKSKYSITLETLIKEFQLEALYMPESASEIKISSTEVDRPGLALAGFTALFDPMRLQIIGRAEKQYLTELTSEQRSECLDRFLAMKPVAVVLTSQIDPCEEMRAKAEDLGKSIFEVVIEASVVEREAQIAEERSIIAGVFNNRIEQGMPLQVDATVLYPLTDGMYDVQRVFYADLEIDSLYNTYRYPGLPVGPICSPGISCLEAVVEPAEHNYLYYHTDEVKKDGSHIFTETYSQHLQTQ